MSKKITLALPLILIIMALGYTMTIKGNIIARTLFEAKYNETSVHIKKELEKIHSKKFSKDEIKRFKNYTDFSQKYKLDEKRLPYITDKNGNETYHLDFKKIDNQVSYEYYVKNNKEKINDSYNIIKDNPLVYTNKRSVKEPIPEYQTFSESLNFQYIKMFNMLKFDKSIAVGYFNRLHENKIKHLSKSNTYIYSFIMLDQLKKDIEFAKYVQEEYDIKLELKELKKEEYDLSEVMDNEIALWFNTKDLEIDGTEEDIRYFHESSYMYIKSLRKHFSKDIEKENLPFVIIENDFGYIEEYGSPVLYILSNVSTPMMWEYKDYFVKYNKSVKEFN